MPLSPLEASGRVSAHPADAGMARLCGARLSGPCPGLGVLPQQAPGQQDSGGTLCRDQGEEGPQHPKAQAANMPRKEPANARISQKSQSSEQERGMSKASFQWRDQVFRAETALFQDRQTFPYIYFSKCRRPFQFSRGFCACLVV